MLEIRMSMLPTKNLLVAGLTSTSIMMEQCVEITIIIIRIFTHNNFSVHCTVIRARKIFEFNLARWASNSQLLLVRGTYPLAQVFKLINNS